MAETKNFVKDENFIVIQGWMRTELNLKGNELLVYAVIYGFSQTENQFFTGSLRYLTEWIGSSRQTVINCLNSLIKKDLIFKKEKIVNGVKFCEYQTKKLMGSQKNRLGVVKKLDGGSQNFSVDTSNNNIEYTIEDKIEETAPTTPPEEKIPYSEILEAYHTLCPSLPKVQKLSNDRKKAVRARIHDGFTVEQMKQAFSNAEASLFLTGKVAGKDGRTFKANFDWIMTDKYFVRVLEDKYADMKPPAQQKPEPEKQNPAFNPYSDAEWDGEW